MGLGSPSLILHSVRGVSIEDLHSIAIAIKNSSCKSSHRQRPAIDIDASWLGYYCGTGQSNSISTVLGVGKFFAAAGFDVFFVADNVTKFHWKRATFSRMATRSKAGIQAVKSRIRLNRIVDTLSNDNIGEKERASLLEEKKKLSTSIPNLESKSKAAICSDFNGRLEKAIEDQKGDVSLERSNMVGSISFITAAYQADSCLAKRRIDRKSDLILSSDSDFAVVAEDDEEGGTLIVVNGFERDTLINASSKRRTMTLSNFSVYSPTDSSLKTVIRRAGVNIEQLVCTAAKYPVFDECSSIRMRALVAVGIGCDQNPGGVKNVGPSTVLAKLQSLNKKSQKEETVELESKFAQWLGNRPGTSQLILSVFADALMYEPGNEVGQCIAYIHGVNPMELENYLADIAHPQTKLTDELEVALCPGSCIETEHKFLLAECDKKIECQLCHRAICRFCVSEVEDNPAIHQCLSCQSSNAILPGNRVILDITINEMRDQLAKAGVKCNKNIEPNIVEDLYVEHVMTERMKLFNAANVKYPLLSSNELPNTSTSTLPRESTKLKCLGHFDWNNGGSFLRMGSLTPQNVADLVGLLAGVLVLSDKAFEKGYQKELGNVLPKMVVDFAADARLDGAWRLMYRAIRGALDKRCPSMIKSIGAVVEYEGSIGLLLSGQIRASMKGKVYDGTIAFTLDDLLACKCTCKSGAENNERIACVHSMAKIFQLYVFIVECLADHAVYELAASWTKQHENALNEEEKQRMMASLRRLISTAGLDEKLIDSNVFHSTSVSDLLSAFSVGTEQRKLAPPPPDPLKLGPFRLLKGKLHSLVNEAAAIKEKLENNQRQSLQNAARAAAGYSLPATITSPNSPHVMPLTTYNEPDYDMIFAMVSAVVETYPFRDEESLIYDFIGYYFEVVGGMSTTRQKDAEARYGSRRVVKRAVKNKLEKVLKCRKRWPHYASLEEDEVLRDPKWDEQYRGLRVVMWDNTNLNMNFKPSNAEIQSLTFSSYYHGNVAKGGVYVQFCGWQGAHELWMGAVSDTGYFQDSGILEQQQKFVGEEEPFLNMLDRGYRVARAAMLAGRQITTQPAFSRSDRKFNTNEVVSSAGVASHRSGNERGVLRCKMSGYLKRGLYPNQDVDEFCDVWLAWSFQVNFMYKPML